MESVNLENRPADTPGMKRLAQKVGRMASDTGFLLLEGHGIAEELIGRCFLVARQFFAMDSEAKNLLATTRFRPENPNSYRGYFPLLQDDPSFKEGFEFGRCSYPDRSFPETTLWPAIVGFKETLQEIHLELSALAGYLLKLLSIYLDKDPSFMQEDFQDGMSTFRIIHYPEKATREITSHQEFSTPDHTDSGFITLLIQDDTGGLEALWPGGHWKTIEPSPGTIVMNLGDLLSFISGNTLKATRHRVRSPSRSRISMPFFYEPSPDTLIPYPVAPGDNESKEVKTGKPGRIRYADYLTEKIQSFGEYSHKKSDRLA